MSSGLGIISVGPREEPRESPSRRHEAAGPSVARQTQNISNYPPPPLPTPLQSTTVQHVRFFIVRVILYGYSLIIRVPCIACSFI